MTGATWLRFSNPLPARALGPALDQAMADLLSAWSPDKSREVGAWFEQNFRVRSPKTPRGMKGLKDQAEKLRWWLTAGPSSYANQPETVYREVGRLWSEIRPQLGDLVRGFTDEGGAVVPREIAVGENTYVNEVGVGEAALKRYVARLEGIFAGLKGWHREALVGGVVVVLASPRNFRGTAGGTYKSREDKLYVRATPNVLNRTGGLYGSFEYILTHEIGHRYEYKNRLPVDFDRHEWLTTDYSHKEGESFAELFALSNLGLLPHPSQRPWDPGVVERFQALMSRQGATAKPALPEHLRRFSEAR